ncbi:hypothetical protein GGQ87_000266 [Brevundimonas alba]|uniref:Uncharacterized protein n=1 Tax=Brevundimonas alba TaxID=74314 RepID=A0A7X5YHG4_9CAUL|nr:hypothetical protein [Brevundimonas alba]NJC40008.1 hypothetical protein [Brevundimonas alba]
MIFRFGIGLLLGACMFAGGAAAQTASRPSTPFVIHGVAVDSTERTAREGQPLLAQPVTSVRSARLDAEAPAESAGWFKDKSFAAGTPMFGAYAGDQWSYCAVAESRQSFWTTDQFICYVDADDDGRFDSAIDSGTPFNGVPLLVFSTGASRPLPAPVPYSRLPLADGPSVEYAISYEIVRPHGRAMLNGRNVPRAATHIVPVVGFRVEGGRIQPLSAAGGERRIPLAGGQQATIRVKGAVIEILGVNNDDSVRYRVVETIPSHVDQIMLQIITTTTWVVY